MAEVFPRKVFRVVYRQDGTPFVAVRTLVGRNGSWYTTKCKDGTEHRENGNKWCDTMIHALQQEAGYIMHRFRNCSSYCGQQQLESMDRLIELAVVDVGMEIGEMLSMINRK